MNQLEKICDQHLLHTFLQDCEELHDWIVEKNVVVQQDTYRSATTISVHQHVIFSIQCLPWETPLGLLGGAL